MSCFHLCVIACALLFNLGLPGLWEAAFADEKKDVASGWCSTEIKVDGSEVEWTEAITYLEKEKLGFGIKNDSTALYLCLKFDREIQRQAMMYGFTIWFDPSGKNKKAFGIRFPIGMMNYDDESMLDPMLPVEDGGGRQRQFAEMLREVEVLGPGKDDRNRFSSAGSFNILAAASESPSELVCELKIPLQSAPGRPYAIGAELGQTLSVGFEMGEWNRDKMRERMRRAGGVRPPGGFPPGSMPPGGGMRGGGRPGGGPPGETRMPKAFKIWLRVNLAAGATTFHQGFIPQNDLGGVRVTLEARNVPLREALKQVISQ
ncbi:MAG: hypothetical protein ONB44_00525 [candidate division KSB1 bacterium]|nr:hypothetical protein [candidate division KSB1 bacterium]MDZ7300605.1 hypothetical protein [candidate division KSB1 bacterium]MDZ7309742.1 hypothetical protein [candidate division KSB1 bacterium]